ncbi:MAG: SAM-dependent methyltransferase [Gammaproteobacteria bacterium]|jgi:SAM-dependent MidA family methyltransferase
MSRYPNRLKTLEKQLAQLPSPPPQAQHHSQRLVERIVDEIKQGGPITFERYMALALTAPGLGYYVAGNHKLGAAGDFVTAPQISPVFSRCLARQCEAVLRELQAQGPADILEFGAGSGIMVADVLLELEQRECLPGHYFILEVSGELVERQRQTLQTKAPHLLSRVQWLDTLPKTAINGIVLANEVLDALPVHRFYKEAASAGECYVDWNGERFVWQHGPFSSPFVEQRVDALLEQLPSPYISELNLAAEAWVGSLGDILQRGVVLIIDYGFPQKEYYHPQRCQGTLMCHYQHRAHDDPFVYPGLQDITAHVDFTAVAHAAHDAGLRLAGYNTQAFFLIANGLEEFARSLDVEDPAYVKLAQQIKTLTMPGEMGELFKVMALAKQFDQSLQGFALQDMRGRL